MPDLDIHTELQQLPDGEPRRLAEDVSALLARQVLPRGEVSARGNCSRRAATQGGRRHKG
jgi:hypothetical protein